MFKLKYVDRLKPLATSANLVFGNAVHKAIEHSLCNPGSVTSDESEKIFLDEYEALSSVQIVKYGSTFSRSDLIATGKHIARDIPYHVETSRFVAAIIDDKPAIEVPFSVRLTDEIEYMGYIDWVAMNLDTEKFGLIDNKTSASSTPSYLTSSSNQLIGYSFAETLDNFPTLDFYGFWDFQKRKVSGKGPEIHPIQTSGKFSVEQRNHMIDQVIWVDKQITEKAFFKDPRSAYNSPCQMCDYREFCHDGDASHLQ